MGHMTPVEAPEAVTAKIRELVTRYVAEGAGARGTAGQGKAATAEKEDVA